MDTVDETYLSIGEVLALLQEEFPDVTISKIRFLESQGLIEPERTPSGYRRFHDPDIERLRWVLRQQRDHFLPLKVIKAKLEEGSTSGMDQPPLWTSIDANGSPHTDAASRVDAGPRTDGVSPVGDAAQENGVGSATAVDAGSSMPSAPSAVSAESDPAAPDLAGEPHGASGRRDPGAWLAELQEAPRGMPVRDMSRSRVFPPSGVPAERLSSEELIERTGTTQEHVAALIDYGLLHPTTVSGERLFDIEAIEVVVITARLMEYGVEVRHLRGYRLDADREAAVIEQLLFPLLKQRNPDARARAMDTYAEFTSMGEALRRVLLHQALAPHLR